MTARKQQKGFTIIEVVLVLAIAALIFLMVFIALPALQRTQHDTARTQDINLLATAASNYGTNHNGLPPTASNALDKYVTKLSEFESIAVKGTLTSTVSTISDSNKDIIQVWAKATCSDDGAQVIRGSSRQTAAIGLLESGDVYCRSV